MKGFCHDICSYYVVRAGKELKHLRINSWGTITLLHVITQPSRTQFLPPLPSPPCLPIMNFNHFTSMTLTFSYSEQPPHPLMCDLWSILPMVNLGWQRVAPCWGWGWTNKAWDRSLGAHLKIKRWGGIKAEGRRLASTCLEQKHLLHSEYLCEMDCATGWVLPSFSSWLMHSSMASQWHLPQEHQFNPVNELISSNFICYDAKQKKTSEFKITTAARGAKVQIHNPLIISHNNRRITQQGKAS